MSEKFRHYNVTLTAPLEIDLSENVVREAIHKNDNQFLTEEDWEQAGIIAVQDFLKTYHLGSFTFTFEDKDVL